MIGSGRQRSKISTTILKTPPTMPRTNILLAHRGRKFQVRCTGAHPAAATEAEAQKNMIKILSVIQETTRNHFAGLNNRIYKARIAIFGVAIAGPESTPNANILCTTISSQYCGFDRTWTISSYLKECRNGRGSETLGAAHCLYMSAITNRLYENLHDIPRPKHVLASVKAMTHKSGKVVSNGLSTSIVELDWCDIQSSIASFLLILKLEIKRKLNARKVMTAKDSPTPRFMEAWEELFTSFAGVLFGLDIVEGSEAKWMLRNQQRRS